VIREPGPSVNIGWFLTSYRVFASRPFRRATLDECLGLSSFELSARLNISNSSRSDDEVEIILSARETLKLQLSKEKDAAKN
jgi:hypothetical protein